MISSRDEKAEAERERLAKREEPPRRASGVARKLSASVLTAVGQAATEDDPYADVPCTD